MNRLERARVAWQDGVPTCPAVGDVFHAREGGIGQARQVFLGGNDLPGRWAGRDRFCIAEVGFGGGTNFLTTWAQWRDDPRRCGWLDYVSAEHRPWTVDDLHRLHTDTPLAPLAEALIAQWPPPLEGFHALHFEGGRVRLLLLFGEALKQFQALKAPLDALYLDGFAPNRNPQAWAPSLIAELAARCRMGATAASYSVAAPVRTALAEQGFAVRRRPGFGRKREALSAVLERPGAATAPGPRQVAVLGAGLAGCAVARALAEQGLEVQLLDPASGPAQGASGNPLVMVRPWVSRDDPPATALTRAAFLHALRDPASPMHALAAGLVHLPRSEPEAERFRAAAARAPQGLLQWLDREAASERAGIALPRGGLWVPEARRVDPHALCAAWLTHPAIEPRWGETADPLRLLGRFDAVVLAAAHAVNGWLMRPLPLSRIRGQVSLLPAGALPRLRCTVSHEGYVIPMADGGTLVGAGYDRDDAPQPDLARHAANAARLAALGLGPTLPLERWGGRVGFRAVLPDRLPALGPVPDQLGLWLATAYASRGATWARLLGEVLAARLLDAPVPLPAPLITALDPARAARWPTSAPQPERPR